MDYIVAGLVTAFALIIVARILDRAGFGPWWALLLFVPGANLVGLWVLAFVRWPRLDDETASD